MAKPIIIKALCCFLLLLVSNILYAATLDQLNADRVVAISAQFLNKPYLLEPLGEGPTGQFNQEPLYRFDAFDCETYIDTVLALTLPVNFKENILQIRYRNGIPNFYNRNHFPETDWLPNNESKGFVIDITTQIANPSQLESKTVTIDYQDWYKNLPQLRIKIKGLSDAAQAQKLIDLHAHARQSPANKTVTITYIKSSAVPDVENKIPNGAIIVFIKPQHIPGTDMLISHMGLSIWENNVLYLRGASSLYGRVVDLPLMPYLKKMKDIQGIKILIPG